MVFQGRVQFRSSSGPRAGSGPPGESEVQQLNPGRERRIREVTGWDRLTAGSLNLAVADSVVQELARYEPMLVEPSADIVYPAGYEYIPRLRGAYWYYPARAEKCGILESVLVRRAQVPLAGIVELFSPKSLKSRFPLDANDLLTVEILAPLLGADAGA
jgi:hypothetical protein